MQQLQINSSSPVRAASSPVLSTLVPEGARMGFLPRHFNARVMLLVESKVYAWMERLCRVYSGGRWDFFDLSNGGGFMAPSTEEPFDLHIEALHLERRVSAEVAGIIATGFALRSLLWAGHTDLADKYRQLLDFVATHTECALLRDALE